MNVMVTGGRGFVGNFLTGMLVARGDHVTVVSRNPESIRSARAGVQVTAWLPDLAPFETLVHLAGEPIFGKRWSAEQKDLLRTSRVDSTRRIVQSLAELSAEQRPKVLVSASAIGYYGDRGDEVLSEDSAAGDDFLARLCQDWEREASAAEEHGVRVVCLRIGIVVGLGGGALGAMLPPFRAGVGGPIGSGRNWMSWIHIRDLCRLAIHAIDTESLTGPLNATAAEPVTNKEFSRTLGRVLRRPALLPVPPFALRLLFGEAASVLTGSQRCSHEKARAAGFELEFPTVEPALRQLLHR